MMLRAWRHLYKSCSSTRQSLCWAVKAEPSISWRIAVISRMIDGLLQYLEVVCIDEMSSENVFEGYLKFTP
jgi:hypothetical protein